MKHNVMNQSACTTPVGIQPESSRNQRKLSSDDDDDEPTMEVRTLTGGRHARKGASIPKRMQSQSSRQSAQKQMQTDVRGYVFISDDDDDNIPAAPATPQKRRQAGSDDAAPVTAVHGTVTTKRPRKATTTATANIHQQTIVVDLTDDLDRHRVCKPSSLPGVPPQVLDLVNEDYPSAQRRTTNGSIGINKISVDLTVDTDADDKQGARIGTGIAKSQSTQESLLHVSAEQQLPFHAAAVRNLQQNDVHEGNLLQGSDLATPLQRHPPQQQQQLQVQVPHMQAVEHRNNSTRVGDIKKQQKPAVAAAQHAEHLEDHNRAAAAAQPAAQGSRKRRAQEVKKNKKTEKRPAPATLGEAFQQHYYANDAQTHIVKLLPRTLRMNHWYSTSDLDGEVGAAVVGTTPRKCSVHKKHEMKPSTTYATGQIKPCKTKIKMSTAGAKFCLQLAYGMVCRRTQRGVFIKYSCPHCAVYVEQQA